MKLAGMVVRVTAANCDILTKGCNDSMISRNWALHFRDWQQCTLLIVLTIACLFLLALPDYHSVDR